MIGKVTNILPEAIMIDVSGKALGIIDRREIPESETPQEGEQMIARVANDGSRGGLVVLTRDNNRWQKSRVDVETAFNEKQAIEGLITGVVKSPTGRAAGVEVDVNGLRAFAPASQVELRPGADCTI